MQGYQINTVGEGFTSDIRSMGSNTKDITVKQLINELIKANIKVESIIEIIKYNTFIKSNEGYFGYNLIHPCKFETLSLDSFSRKRFVSLETLNDFIKANFNKRITKEYLLRLFNSRLEYIINPRNNYYIEHVINKVEKVNLKKHLIDLHNIATFTSMCGTLYEVSKNDVMNKVIIASASNIPLTMIKNKLVWL